MIKFISLRSQAFTHPAFLYTIAMVGLVFVMHDKKWFFINLWWGAGFLQLVGIIVNKIRLRRNEAK